MPQDLRSYIDLIREHKLLLDIKKEVDPLSNLAGIAYRGENEQGKATMFHNLKGYKGWTAVSYMCGSREKMALGLGTTKDKALVELGGRISRGLIKPKIVEDGPVKEVVWKGDDADLGRLPIHVHSDSDRGVPFIGSAMQFVKDPETGTQNIALQRDHIKGAKKMGIFVHPKRHTDICMQKYWKAGKPMPVATVIGHHPAYYIASTWTTSYETDEVDIAGALLQEPANMVRCETIDVMVPAEAEIVIEGEVPPNYMEDEGPFCEHAGMTHGTLQQPIINVKCITMRKNAIYYALQGGRPISESQPLDGFPMELVLYARIKDVGGFIDVKDVVALPYAGGSHIIVVQMSPRKAGEVRSTLMALLSSPYLHPKIGIAVDDDIDPHNAQSIMYALSTRVNPKSDVFIIPDTLCHTGDLTAELLPDTGAHMGFHPRIGSKMLIDATKGAAPTPELRAYFEPVKPMGLVNVKLEEFLG
ncbi:MAG TPA: UbiD family decarboxylase [Candidatus Binatia bacterium]|nr:UbiD family decarboxylase [Candidatus Binatia bacterium]